MESLLALIDANKIFNLTTLAHYWDGLLMTVQLVFMSLLIGLIISVPLAIMRNSKNPFINYPVWLFWTLECR